MSAANLARPAAAGVWGAALLTGSLLLLAGCGRGGGGAAKDTVTSAGSAAATPSSTATAPAPAARESTPTPPRTPSTSDTPPPKPAPAGKPAAKPQAGGAAGGPTSPQLIALGDSIFHGQVAGGTCTACHGQDAKGTAVAPDLTDSEWLNGDGSYEFLVKTITEGVPKPKKHPAPMPPKGGAMLTDAQVRAVAAYEYSLSHKT